MRARLRALPAAVAVLAATLAMLAALLGPTPPGAVSADGGGVVPEPTLGSADSETVLMGAAAQTGDAWAYRQLPITVGSAVAGRPVEFAPVPDPSSPDPQLAFLRSRSGGLWRVVETPVDESGSPYRGPVPNPLSPRITPAGGGVLVGRDTRRPVDRQAVVLVKDPGGRFKVLDAPGPAVLLPASGGDPAETLAGDRGAGAVAMAAFDDGNRTGVFIAPQGRDVEDAILRWDGLTWTREPVQVPVGSEAFLQPLAVAATSATNAWMVARAADAASRGIVLFQRVLEAGSPVWKERDLAAPVFADGATPAEGVSGVRLLGGAADPLTATADGVWIDAGLDKGGARYDATLFFDPNAAGGRVRGSWCDAPGVCDFGLNARISSQRGYRSFAWAGPGFGTRIITNPLAPGGDEETNRGTYLRLDGTRFERMPGAGGNFRRSGAFLSADEGWLEGPVRITSSPSAPALRSWPLALRAPLTAIVSAPGAAPGALGSAALAVGGDGGVARYAPGRGWEREFLLTSSGAVSRPLLRGVAWPEAGRAHAVGDLGAMWLWRAETDLWERDPAAPPGLEANLMDVAFDPVDPDRGYAVGKAGTLLRYGKTWEQEALPGGVGDTDLTQIAFAGRQAIVAAGASLLVNSGGGWQVDAGAAALLDTVRSGSPRLFAVAGLPDGGAVAAGRDVVIVRDGAGGPWRFADQPLPGATVVALGAFREGGAVRAVASVVPQIAYPQADELPPPDPNVPPPILPPFPLPGDGYLLRETADGWRDEQHTAFAGSGPDRPIKSDPILAFDLDAGGGGWAVGGWSGQADSAGRGSSAAGGLGRADRARVQTAGAYRYDPGRQPAGPPAAAASPVPLADGVARFAVAGHGECEAPCADLRAQGIAPDRTVQAALATMAELAGRPGGPRALLWTGGRLRPGAGALSEREAARYAQVLGGQPALPVYPALSAADTAGGSAAAVSGAFGGFPAPFGAGAAPGGVSTGGVPGGAGGGGARTHYAFDSAGPGGTVRVVVIDNSQGSLAASDPYQNPAEPQTPWLVAVLQDARAKGIPAIVVGSRNLNPRIQPSLNTASDGPEVARILLDNGASAYLFERPEEQRAVRIPAGSTTTIPSFGTGTLSYRSPISNATSQPDELFGDTGYLLFEVDAAKRDAATNRAPVAARLVPLLDDLALQAVDGTLIRRSRVALFQGLGRRPLSGDRWGRASAGGSPNPPGGSPYVSFPPDLCVQAGCVSRMTPEYRFTSSDPDIGDFVRQDPNSTNLRKPLLGRDDKPITDATSGLFCAFNAGKTTVTVEAGGLRYATTVTVQAGSVQRPCGTRPLAPGRFTPGRPQAVPSNPAPPPPAPASSPPPALAPPPPPAVVAAVPPPTPIEPAVKPPPAIVPPPPLATAVLPPLSAPGLPPTTPPPSYPGVARPIPPGGAVARVFQVEEKREEEVAPEQQSAFARYDAREESRLPGGLIVAMVVVLAASGAAVARGRPRGGGRRRPLPAVVTARGARQLRSTRTTTPAGAARTVRTPSIRAPRAAPRIPPATRPSRRRP